MAKNFDIEQLHLDINKAQKRLRDEFAMAALTGIMADPKIRLDTDAHYAAVAEQSYKLAIAMLKAREGM